MNNVTIAVCLCLWLGALQRKPIPSFGEARIVSGHVFYRNGSAVKNATVEIDYFGAMGMILPTAQTDASGHFSISTLPLGDGVVSASKEEEGYPNAAIALYGWEDYTSLKRINTASISAVEEINLRFVDPDAVIEWTVESSATQASIKGARYTISLSNNARIYSSGSIPNDGKFRFVLPKHPVAVKITAPGFADWSYTEEHSHLRQLSMKPGTLDQRTIYLR